MKNWFRKILAILASLALLLSCAALAEENEEVPAVTDQEVENLGLTDEETSLPAEVGEESSPDIEEEIFSEAKTLQGEIEEANQEVPQDEEPVADETVEEPAVEESADEPVADEPAEEPVTEEPVEEPQQEEIPEEETSPEDTAPAETEETVLKLAGKTSARGNVTPDAPVTIKAADVYFRTVLFTLTVSEENSISVSVGNIPLILTRIESETEEIIYTFEYALRDDETTFLLTANTITSFTLRISEIDPMEESTEDEPEEEPSEVERQKEAKEEEAEEAQADEPAEDSVESEEAPAGENMVEAAAEEIPQEELQEESSVVNIGESAKTEMENQPEELTESVQEEEPAEEPAAEPVEEIPEEPAEEPAVEPVEENPEEPAEEPAVEPVEENPEAPVEESVAEPAEEKQEEQNAEESTEESVVEPVEDKQEEPAEEPVAEPVEENPEEPMEEPVAERAEDVPTEDSANEIQEESAVQFPEDAAVDFVISWDEANPSFGSVAHFQAQVSGCDGVDYTLQWQISDDCEVWEDIPGETNEWMDLTITEENCMKYWRVVICAPKAAEEQE